MANQEALATVVAINGKAFVKNENGEIRELKVGDILVKGDIVITEAGNSVELGTSDGDAIQLLENQQVAITEDLSADQASGRQDSEVAQSTIDTVLQALENNQDLSEILASTAAGAGAGSEGHSFLRLNRIFESLDLQGETLSANSTETLPVNDPILGDDGIAVADSTDDDVTTPPPPPPPPVGNAPVLGADGNATVQENTTVVGNYAGSDADGDTLTYSLSGADAALFTIDAAGNLNFINAPDFDTNPGPFNVSITATDSGSLSATQNLTVNVTNVIENTQPVSGADVTIEIAENSMIVGNYAATDADGDVIAYSLSGADAALFQIDTAGNLSFIAAPDFETNPGPFNVTITATDDGEGTLSDSQNITVNVTNVIENNAPTLGDDVVVPVVENTTAVGNYAATDADGDTVSYTLSGTDAALFQIDATGNLSFIAAPDFETNPGPFNVSITATDDGEGTLSDAQNITVNVTEANDNAPIISITANDVTEEAVAVGTVMATFTASDPDGDALTYQLLSNADGYFALSGTNVELTAAGVAAINSDALNLSALTITVEASDGTNATSASDTSTITRVNDNAPTIAVTANDVTEESVAAGDVIATFTASDPDGDALTYQLLNNAGGYFALNGSNVELTAAGVAAINNDSLNLTSLNIQVEASDGTNVTSANDTSNITRVNDNAPTISVTANDVTEEAVTAGDVIATFTASDPDGDALTYQLLNNADGYFALNGTNVELTAAGVAAINNDALNLSSVTITVEASDGANAVSASDTSTITRVNDNAPTIAVTANDVTEESVTENMVVATFTATDPDGDALTYQLLNNADGYFALNGNNVELTSAGVVAINDDSLNLSSLTITVEASDGTNATSASDTSNITRVNDNAQTIAVTANDVTEESVAAGDVIATFTASDPDGDALTYQLLNNADGYFVLNGTNVELTAAGVAAINNDALNLSNLTITVEASDGVNTISASDTSTITRVNDNAPTISVTAIDVTEENVTENMVIATFTASDPDGDALTYQLLNNADGYFALNGSNVELTAAGVAAINNDALNLSSVTITVEASDGTNVTSGSDTSTITRVNDNAPVIAVTANDVTEESVAAGDVIATFTASDPDGDALTYQLLNNADGYFVLNGTNVELTAAGVAAINNDSLNLSSLTITVEASDGTNATSANDTSTITRVNDNAPIISVTANDVTEEAVTAGDVIATFTASDPDGDALTYQLLNNADGYFALNGTNVELTAAGVAAINNDALNLSSVTITVEASDGANATSASDTSNITRVNDGSPSITVTANDLTEESVTENMVVATFTTSDPDGDALTYQLLNNADGYFALNGNNVELTSAGVVAINDDSLNLSSLTITVEASDGVNTISASDTSTITRVNDNAPVIAVTANDVTEESVAAGDVIATFTANDPDGDALTYQLLNNADGYFVLNGTNVELTAAGVAAINNDSLNLSSLTITVEASDGTNATSASDTSTITRVNDNAPTISVTAVDVTEESVTENMVVATFTANDPDGDVLTYQLLNNADGYFALNGNNVELTDVGVNAINNDSLNLSSLTITVEASDGTNATSASDTSNITRVNDNAPTIAVTANDVTEESVAAGDVIATFAASDPDGDALTYQLLNNADGYFVLNGTNVELTAVGVAAINNDSLNLTSLNVQVEASDGTNATSANDTSTITRVNDNAPTISVTAIDVTEESVTENMVVATFAASDPDGDVLIYQLLNNADGYFALNGNNVELTDVGVNAINNDSLNLSSLTITVEASDGTNATSASDTSTITRVNDNAPTISVTANDVTEEAVAVGTVMATFTASDPDGDALTYQLLNNTDGYFALNGANVELTAAGVAAINNDSLNLSSLTITVEASDGTNATSANDTSTITRVNDNAPTISVTAIDVTEENVTENMVVATFAASDPDGDALTYQLLNNADGYFALNGTNVELTSAGVVAINDDSLNLSSLTITVEASDGVNTISASDTSTITRVNDNAPVIAVTANDVTEEAVAIGTVMATFTASDPDGDALTYQLLNNTDGYFVLNGINVELTAAGVAAINNDNLNLSSLTITVEASDGTNTTSANDTSTITRVNDNAPTISVTAVDVTEENVTENMVVATFTANDPDGDALTYQLLNNADGYFALNGNNVELTDVGVTAINNDNLNLSSLTITVEASDGTNVTSASDTSTITRVNDNAPVIAVTANDVTEESVAAGDVIATFTASDPDGDALTYQLLNNADGYLVLNGTNVELTAAGVAAINNDSLNLSSLTITVEASDGTNATSANDTSTITRVNDNAPTISVTAIDVTEESVTENMVVATFTANDPDGDALTYQLLNNADGYFALNGTNVELTDVGVNAINNDSLNLSSLTITVEASDGTNATSASDTSTITRVNDNAPTISVTANDVTEEAVAVGTVMATFTASDPDGDALTYQLLNNTDGYFALNGANVELTAAGVAAINSDSLNLSSLTITVEASDGTNATSANDTSTITRVNDNAPTINVTAIDVTEESVTENMVVATFTANDPDGDALTYQLLNNADGYFALNGSNVELTAAGVAAINNDALNLPNLSITVEASDDTNTTSASDTSTITRVNDNAPAISVTAVDVTEESVTENMVVATFTASDPDGDALTYQLLNNADGYFALNGTNVELTAAGVAAINNDSLNLSSLTITVEASDGTNATSANDTSTITRVNDNAPTISVTAIDVTEESVTENMVVATFAASDPDGDALTYQLLNNADGYFALNGNNVELTSAGVVAINNDSLNLSSLTITVEASDGTNATSASDTSTITRVNDNAPTIAVTANDVIEESIAAGDVIATFTASDPDGDALTYQLLNNADGYFVLNGTNVELTAAGVAAINNDSLNLSSLNIAVEASDGTNATSASDTSNITRVNDNAPTISVTAVDVTEENVTENMVVATFTANDPDGDALTYQLLNNADGYFALNGNNVELTSAGVVAINNDSLNLSSLTITVEASDGTNAVSASDTSTITRVNDNAPVIAVTANDVTEESVAAGDVIAIFTASDPDGDALTYQLLNNADGYFVLNGTNVELTAVGVAAINNDNLNLSSLTITVEASDGTNATSANDTSTITRVNDNAPTISVTAIDVTEESVTENMVVATFTANDPDGDALTYQLLNNADGYFALNGNNVELTAAGVVAINNDSLNLTSLNVQVEASDGTNVVNASDTSTITRVNDNAPTISVTAIDVTEESVTENMVVATFTASDPDGDALTYQLLNNADGYFVLNGTNVELTAAGVAAINNDSLNLSSLTITVEASDGTNATSANDTSTITRVNDNAPTISVTAIDVTEENVTENMVVATFAASDPDGDALTYQLLNNADGYFALNGTNVELTDVGVNAINNDSLNLSSLTITVEASDGTNATSASDTSTITRVNDNAPTIAVTANDVTEESVAAGDMIATFTASDPDGDALTYQLLNNADGYFALNGTNVELTAAGVAAINNDSLNLSSLTITVEASDGTNATSANDTSTITRVNDSAPTISVTAIDVTEENVTENMVVATFAASDPDGDALTYQLLNNADGYFALNGTNVELTSVGVVAINDDSLNLSSLTITVEASDGVNTISASDTSTITRVNDNAPVIAVTANDVTEESVAAGDVIATFTASDPDGDALTYQLLNNADGYFVLNGTNVELTAAGVAAINNDSLNLSSLTITVEASDGTNATSANDTSTITRVNDNAPTISVTAIDVTEEGVTENMVIATFTASDPDGDALTYQLLNNADGYFALNGNNVELTDVGVNAINNDSLNLSSVTITVEASDGTNATSASDTSTITRVNDNAPVIAVTANDVTEESVATGDVIATFTASDPDGDALTYQLLNNTDGYFVLNGTSVELTAAGVAAINNDSLNLSNLSITVEASDGTNTTSASDTSTITRVNDNAPTISVTAIDVTEESVTENMVVATFTANDPDGDALTYQLLNNADGYFALNGNNVELTSAGVVAINDDSLNLSSLTITVEASDGTNAVSASDTSTITRVNDNAPVIAVTANDVTEESVAAGDVIATFTASDPDGDALTYQLLNNADGYFVLNGTNVELTAVGVAAINNDNLNLSSLTITVEASDGTNATSANDTSTITRVNDNAPTISVTAVDVTEESVTENMVVATFTANDPDGDPLTYQLLNNADGYFALNGNNVELTDVGVNAINNDSLNLLSLTITVEASDGTNATSASDTSNITRVNDNAPTIAVTANDVTEESVAAGDVIATFTANDPDGDALTYQLLNNADGYFVLNGTNVELTTAGVAAINSDALNLSALTITVEASDGTNATSANDTSTITRVNDNAPTISVTAVDVTEESVTENMVVATFTANDPDGDALTYQLLNNADGYFALNGNNVELTDVGVNAINNDSLNLSSLTITVEASDGTNVTSASDTSNITRVNDNAPTISVTANDVTEEAVAVGTVMATFTASDSDGDALTYQLLNNASGYFVLNGNNVELTATGVAAINNDSLNLTSLNIQVQASDGTNTSSASDTSIVTRINDAPILDLDANNSAAGGNNYVTSFTEGGSSAYIADIDVSINDVDDAQLESATITIQGVQAGDLLIVGALPAGISASGFNSATGQITLTGSASLAAYQAALRAVQFSNDGSSTTASRDIQITVNDGETNSNIATTTVNITTIPTVNVSDVSVQEPASGTTTLTFTVTVDEVLGSNLTFNYNTANITAVAGADYVAATNGIATINAGSSSTTITITINSDANNFEGDETFALNLSNFNQTVNYAPGGTQGIGTIGANNGAPVATDDSFITQPDTALTTGNVFANDELVDNAVLSTFDTASINGGTVSSNGDGTFTYTPANGFSGTDSFTYTLIDDDGETSTATVSIEVTANVVEAPVVTNVPDSSYTENSAAVNVLSGVSINDADSTSLSSVVVQVSGFIGSQDQFSYLTAGTSIVANVAASGNNWALTLTGGADITEYLAVLNTLSYLNTSENPSTATRTITVSAYDQDFNNISDSDVGSLTITAVNDAPVVVNNDIFTVENNQDTALNIAAPTDFDNEDTTLVITITGIPSSIGTVMLANGTTPVTIGQVLTIAQLTSLVFDAGTTQGSEALTYTVSDGVNTTVGTTTIDVGTTNPDVNTVYEAGLEGGTQVGSSLATGNLLTNDAIDTTLINSVEFGGNTFTANGSGVITVDTPLGVLTVYANNSTPGFSVGDYVYQLQASDASSNDVTEAFTYNFTSGGNFSDTLTISIVDDVPVANNLVEDIPESEEKVFNIMFTLDRSGSMAYGAVTGSTNPGAGEPTRMEIAKQSLAALAAEYFDQSSQVTITLISFASTVIVEGTFNSYDAFVAELNTVVASGNTNYRLPTDRIMTEMQTDLTAQAGANVENISYFISDGEPTEGSFPGDSNFFNFVNANGIDSYAVGIGSSLPADLSALNFIHNIDSLGEGNGHIDPALIVADLSQLESELLSTVPTAFGGNIVYNGSIANILFGADGGYVQEITLNLDGTPTTFTYDGNTVTAPVGNINGSKVTLTTANPSHNFDYGTFTFDFADGNYTFSAPNGTAPATFDFDYTVLDGDGDSASAMATINIIDDKPDARDDLDTFTVIEDVKGNVINGLDTDGGPKFGSGFTPFAAQGGGIDKIVDNADVTSFTYKGETFNLDFTTAPANGSSGSLQWFYFSATDNDGNQISEVYVYDSSDNSGFTFRSNGYYNYIANIDSPDPTPVSVQTTSAANLNEGGLIATRVNGSGNVTYNSAGVGINDASLNTGETIRLTFDSAANPNGVENLVVDLSDFQWTSSFFSTLRDQATFVVRHDSDGDGVFINTTVIASAENGAQIDLTQFSRVIRFDLSYTGTTSGFFSTPERDMALSGVNYSAVPDIADPASPPVFIDYTLTDSDGQSDTARLSLYSIDNTITGTVGNDNIIGGAANDAIIGGDGNDTLSGGAGHDNLSGGAGLDLLIGGAGDDYLSGGLGNDTLQGGLGADHLAGNEGNDLLDGGQGDDIVLGGAGNDLVYGGAGNDRLEGNQGDDQLFGGAGNDRLDGGDGDDVINGGQGSDLLLGGLGVDVFKWSFGDGGSEGSPAIDTIADFNVQPAGVGGDVLDLRDLLVGENEATLSDFLFVEQQGANTVISISSAGGFESGFDSGAVDQQIVLEGVDLLSGFADQNALIQDLITNGKLITD